MEDDTDGVTRVSAVLYINLRCTHLILCIVRDFTSFLLHGFTILKKKNLFKGSSLHTHTHTHIHRFHRYDVYIAR